MDVLIRPMAEPDLEAVRLVYNHYVLNSTCTFQLDPETADERLAWFRGRGPAHPAVVAESGGEVVGWGALSAWKARCAYARSVEASVYVRSVYVRHDLHRRGVGRSLLADLIHLARAAGHHTVLGATCTEHPASLALQEAFGFARVGCHREVGHKFGRWLDVAYTQLML